MHTHKIPNLLETDDLFLFGLTMRQCLILFVGAITSYLLFFRLFVWFPNPAAGLIVGLVFALLFLAGMVALAFAHVYGRGLEEWGVVLLLYLGRPRISLWQPDTPDAFARQEWTQRQRQHRRCVTGAFRPRHRKERAW